MREIEIARLQSAIENYEKDLRSGQLASDERDTLVNRLNNLRLVQMELIYQRPENSPENITKALLKSVYSVSSLNSMVVTVDKSTSTTLLMGQFDASDKKFLILKDFLSSISTKTLKKQSFSLIIAKRLDWIRASRQSSGLTMTNLRKLNGACITRRIDKRWEKELRLQPLMTELVKIISGGIEKTGAIPFDIPIGLEAQAIPQYWSYIKHYAVVPFGETNCGLMIIGIIVDF